MSGGFETVIYTDCVPGQGLSGTAGLQFQAQSVGADPAVMALAQQCLLYEPPADWMRERRPVSQYPPSLAYSREDGLAVAAAGVYLGREANGTREGNQLTHCVATRDPESVFGLIRPAQLFGASFWVTAPATTTECSPVPPGWEPGPYTAEHLQRFASAQPAGAELLQTLVSTLERLAEPAPRRVLFIADQAELVVQWIGAATLLLPRERALGIGFKVFSTNPSYASQPVLAVHPDWSRAVATVDRDQGYVVIDLVENRWTEVAPSEYAAAWVPEFLTGDVYDVLDAVELAAVSGLSGSAARALAWASVARRPVQPADADQVLRWLGDGPEELRNAYGDTVVDVLVEAAAEWSMELLRSLDDMGATGFLDGRGVEVRLALIGQEVDHAARTHEVRTGLAPRMPAAIWGGTQRGTARQRILAIARSEPGPAVDVALRLASRFDIPITRADLGELWDPFVQDWSHNPRHHYDPAAWPCGDELKDALRDVLLARAAGRPAVVERIADLWWPYLLPWVLEHTGARPEGLDAEVLAAAMFRQEDPVERQRVVATVLGRAAAAPDAATAVVWAATVLWRRQPADLAELQLLLEHAPAGVQVSPNVVAGLVGNLLSVSFTPAELDVATQIEARGLADLGDEAKQVLLAGKRMNALREVLPGGSDAACELAMSLVAAPIAVRMIGAPDLLVRLPRIEQLKGKGDAEIDLLWWVLLALPVEFRRRYAAKVRDALAKKAGPVDAVVAFALAVRYDEETKRLLDAETSNMLFYAARDWVAGARKGQRLDARMAVRKLGPQYLKAWGKLDPHLHEQPASLLSRIRRD